MQHRVQFEDFNEKWKANILRSESPRMRDDQVEQDFWKRYMARKTSYAPDRSSRPVVAFLQEQIAAREIHSVLELGPGWGNYTLDLAKSCEKMSCVDISQDVLDFIRKFGAENNLHNIETIHSKWEDFSSDEKYDLIFGYNCFYRLEDLAGAFRKMNQYAGKLCAVGMNTGVAEPWIQEIHESGAKTGWEWKDYIYFVNILYQMGIDPEVKIFPFTKNLSYSTKEDLIRNECYRFKEGTYDPEQAEKILLKYFKQDENGAYTAQAHYRGGLVMWQPV